MKKINNMDEIMEYLVKNLNDEIMDNCHDGNYCFGVIIQQFGELYGELFNIMDNGTIPIVAYIGDEIQYNDALMLIACCHNDIIRYYYIDDEYYIYNDAKNMFNDIGVKINVNDFK